jgi:hypothetical protein
MDPVFAKYYYLGRCLYAALPLVLGVAGLLYYPRRIKKDVESGKLSETEGKQHLKKYRIAFCLILLLGVMQIIRLLLNPKN